MISPTKNDRCGVRRRENSFSGPRTPLWVSYWSNTNSGALKRPAKSDKMLIQHHFDLLGPADAHLAAAFRQENGELIAADARHAVVLNQWIADAAWHGG